MEKRGWVVMKRSEINRALAWAEALLKRSGIFLPRYAYWDMDKWAENKEQLDDIRARQLGWGITDFGAVSYTLRNGEPCRERYIMMREGQRAPLRVCTSRAELINRAGGPMSVEVWRADANGVPTASDVTLRSDGLEQTLSAGAELLIYPGDSISLVPGLVCAFGPKPGYGDLVLSELAQPCRDAAAAPEIDEDERVLHPLCCEYAKLI